MGACHERAVDGKHLDVGHSLGSVDNELVALETDLKIVFLSLYAADACLDVLDDGERFCSRSDGLVVCCWYGKHAEAVACAYEVAGIVEVHLIDVTIGVGYARLERATVLEHGLGFRLPCHVEELKHTLRVVDNQHLSVVAYSEARAASSVEQFDVVALAAIEGDLSFACNINQ